MIAAFFT